MSAKQGLRYLNDKRNELSDANYNFDNAIFGLYDELENDLTEECNEAMADLIDDCCEELSQAISSVNAALSIVQERRERIVNLVKRV
jgi:hypothetical protein